MPFPPFRLSLVLSFVHPKNVSTNMPFVLQVILSLFLFSFRKTLWQQLDLIVDVLRSTWGSAMPVIVVNSRACKRYELKLLEEVNSLAEQQHA
jgi:hypothetical protein